MKDLNNLPAHEQVNFGFFAMLNLVWRKVGQLLHVTGTTIDMLDDLAQSGRQITNDIYQEQKITTESNQILREAQKSQVIAEAKSKAKAINFVETDE